ncbi:MAG: DNA/RNA nuclease SfsA [Pseudomonadota bacterium]
MRFDPPLQPATLVRRYNRFLADVTFEDGTSATAHCANPGTMLSVSTPGSRVWLQESSNPKRKLRWSWKLIELEDGIAGIDTGVPNRIVAEALAAGRIPALGRYDTVRAEVPYAERSRVDFLLHGPDGAIWLEVKNVHLRRTGRLAEFPDCVTKRGARHLEDLAGMVSQGARAVMLYVVQRTDCDRLGLAADLDPAYAAAARQAAAAGVEMLAHGTMITPEAIELTSRLPIDLDA